MENKTDAASAEGWPAVPLAGWKETCDTLHMWTQIVGKVRLALSPHLNHWWEAPLYVTARGLTTSPIPYGSGIFEINYDFMDHQLSIDASWGESRKLKLRPRTVAEFYKEFKDALHALGIEVKIWPMPVEFDDPIRFDQDVKHAAYDADYANRFWRLLVTLDTIFKEFRAGFIGKDSPVHLFWGSFDLCVTRFSGRRAPERRDADPVTKEAYSHEEISAGFWPGGGDIPDAAFYCYAWPEPAGFPQAPVLPRQAFYSDGLKEFILMYEDVRTSADPKRTLLDFLQSTYEAGVTLGKWDRAALERAA